MQLDALQTQLSDLSRRLAGLQAAAHPSRDELERVTQLGQAVAAEEKALAKVEKASAHLRKKVGALSQILQSFHLLPYKMKRY